MSLFLNATLKPKIQQRFGGRMKAMVSGQIANWKKVVADAHIPQQ